jgi:tetratricopeptide (TPR) repeat protein
VARINLRDYVKGIEELIDGDQAEDALAHSRHILTVYPKHVDTYRMMGKAYLETHRHGEASDIFQRVLSSCPDDFVAHIGMSIIREDESNLDAAIWHMERAFESQPSNRAVQDELRRLYGKREGYEPPKVRLTRGALARMYAHGDLYTQAIGELRSALSEDAQRPDLQVLMAEMYYKTNRHAETIEICSKLIEKLPYCLYANRVMLDILRGSQRDVEAQPYLERVEELDPYAAQVDLFTPLDQVPDDSVMIEQLVLEGPANPQPVPRAWTSTLQMPEEPAGFQKEELPDWLSTDHLPETVAEAPAEVAPEPESSVLGSLYSLDPMPGDSKENAPPALIPPVKGGTAALMADQVPDWLRELRPSTGMLNAADLGPQEEAVPVPSEPAAQPRWTDELKEAGFTPTELPEDHVVAANDLPAFLQKPAFEDVETPALNPEDEENLGWLESLAAKHGASEEELLTTPEEREQPAPDWLAAELPPAPAPAAPSFEEFRFQEPPRERSATRSFESFREEEAEPAAELPAPASFESLRNLDPEPAPADAVPSFESLQETQPEPAPKNSKPSEKRDVLAWLDEMAAESEAAAAKEVAPAEPEIEDLKWEPEPVVPAASAEPLIVGDDPFAGGDDPFSNDPLPRTEEESLPSGSKTSPLKWSKAPARRAQATRLLHASSKKRLTG